MPRKQWFRSARHSPDTPSKKAGSEEGGFDGAVKLIDVSRVDAILESVVFDAQPFDGSLMLALLVGMALMKGIAHPFQDLMVESESPEDRAELLFKRLFANVWLVALPLVAGAVVVNVALLLDLTD